MKIVFVGVNSSYSHTMLSYGYVRSWNERFLPDAQWQYQETTVNDDETTFALKVVDSAPAVILATAYLFNQEFLLRVLARVKTLRPPVKIYLGGPQFLGNNAAFLRRYPIIDGVIRGDESSVHLVVREKIEAPGFCYISPGNVYNDGGMAEMTVDGDAIPSPYQLGYFVHGKPFYQLETSRGCGGNCTFCTSARSHGVKLFSLERIRADLQTLFAAGSREIRLVDRTFNEHRSRAMKLLTMFRDEFPSMRFHLEINPARLSDDLMNMMRSLPSGQLHLEAGVQTFNEKTLKAVRRPASAQKTAEGLRQLLTRGNFAVHTDLIAGLPEQQYEDVLNDVTRLIELGPEEIQLENLKVLPGTPLADNPPSGLDWNPEPPYEVLRTDCFTPAELQQARYLSKIIDYYYNVDELRSLFSWAWLNISGFSTTFPEYLAAHGDPLIKPSPQKRLELLDGFARQYNHEWLAELVRFVWLVNGMSAEKYKVKVYKTVRGEIESGEIIINRAPDDNDLKRHFIAEFNFNAAVILSAKPDFVSGNCRYIFYLIHGQNLARLIRLP